MSTVSSTKTKKPLNATMLTIAAGVLVLLALLFLATPLINGNRGLPGNANFTRPSNGQLPQFNQNGQQNGLPGTSTGGTGAVGGQTFQGFQGRQLGNRNFLSAFNLLGGSNRTLVYAIAFLLSLAAAIGMVMTRKWGRILGIVMAAIYILLAIIGLLPQLLFRFVGIRDPIGLIISATQLVLAVVVIILASLPGKAIPAVETAEVATADPN